MGRHRHLPLIQKYVGALFRMAPAYQLETVPGTREACVSATKRGELRQMTN